MNSVHDNGVIRGLSMDHYVIASNDEYDLRQPQQPQPGPIDHSPSEEFTEALMIDNRNKSCLRSSLDDMGYLCGCGGGAIDEAEVVYVKRKQVTPKTAQNSNSKHADIHYSDQRQDASTVRYNGHIPNALQTEDYMAENYAVDAESLKYSSPRVGCMPAGVMDYFATRCEPRPSHYPTREEPRPMQYPIREEPRESYVKQDRYESQERETDESNKFEYDAWKKQMLDNVKAPSLFDTDDAEATFEKSARNEPVGTSSYQNEHSSNQYQDTRQPAQSLDNEELARVRSERKSLQKAREELQSELEAFKRHTRNMTKSSGDVSRSDGSVDEAQRREMEFKEMMVNQKYDEVMKIASSTANLNSNSSNNGLSTNNPLPPTPTQNMNNAAMNQSYMMNVNPYSQTHISPPVSPSLASWNTQHGFEVYHQEPRSPASMPVLGGNSQGGFTSFGSMMASNTNTSLNNMFGVSNDGMARSPASMTNGYNGMSNWSNNRNNENYSSGPKEEEELLEEMKMKRAIMETDLMRMRESMSPHHSSSPKYGSAAAQSPAASLSRKGSFSSNGILRPSSYNNGYERSQRGYR